MNLPLRFKIRGPVPPTTGSLTFDFAFLPPSPTIFLWDESGDWVQVAQRLWTGAEWIPIVS